ncbi:hypothetical protein AWH62_15690 [Maricaulis sp. W15]|uniref:Lectin-like protein BA14k n=1 Tax=Maricaulis maris TaxID=74318 RepID=A0A495DF06_9PROT|nr:MULTISPECIES: hypothetical protein [Maricaulis]OLF78276.1 hypothetical protein AWH62_15690 [Maricaulis sp. W15]RKR00495.1 hypothetical protein C7435_1703 [Maricaulis maris]
MLNLKQIAVLTALGTAAASAPAALAQSSWSFGYSQGQSASRDYHASYYEHGYDRHEFRYYREACQPQRRGGLGLGLSLGGAPVLSASVGSRWTECDRGQFSYAQYEAFDQRRAAYWHNPDSGRRGVVRPERHYRRHGQECASGHAEVYERDGDYQRFDFESCRDGSGHWRFEGRSGR